MEEEVYGGNVIQEANGYLFTHLYFTILFDSSSIRPTTSITKMATKDRTLVAIILCAKELTEYLYQKEVVFLLASRDLWEGV